MRGRIDCQGKFTNSDDTVDSIIRSIYDSALNPELWSSTCGLLRDFFSSTASGIFTQNRNTNEFVILEANGFDEAYLQSYDDHYAKVNPWYQPQCLMGEGRILTDQSLDHHYKKKNCYRNTEFYNDWARPQAFDHSLGGTLAINSDWDINFTYFRPTSAGLYTGREVKQHASFASHISKALDISQRLQISEIESRASNQILDNLNCGVISLDMRLNITYLNPVAERTLLSQAAFKSKSNRLVAVDVDDNDYLQSTLKHIIKTIYKTGNASPAFVNCGSAKDGTICKLTILAMTSKDQLMTKLHSRILVLISNSQTALVPDQVYLQHRYGMTTSEACLAQQLAQGKGLRAVAETMGLAYETARSYLKTIFQKTACHRQNELVYRLLNDYVNADK